MHVFVAGATGAVGRELVPLLLAAGHRVTGTTRSESGVDRLRTQGATGVQLDVFDADAVKHAVATAAPDVVVHQLTALSGGTPAANGLIRRVGTRNLVEAAKLAAVPRMVAQSIAWAYAPGDDPATEDTPLDLEATPPRATTIAGVRALEDAVAEVDEHVVLRYGLLYGPGTWYHRDGIAADVLRGDRHDPAAAFVGDLTASDAVASLVHVEDAARAAVDALTWPTGQVNIVDDEPARARDWLPALAEALGTPAPRDGSGRQPWERGAHNTRARALGWTPRYPTWRTGFRAL